MKYALALTGCLVLSACAHDPVSTAKTDNTEISVDKLFTHGNCTIYRFRDEGIPIYYADCGGSASTSWEQDCGKGCTRPVTVASYRP